MAMLGMIGLGDGGFGQGGKINIDGLFTQYYI
jgi:hypothetical protein